MTKMKKFPSLLRSPPRADVRWYSGSSWTRAARRRPPTAEDRETAALSEAFSNSADTSTSAEIRTSASPAVRTVRGGASLSSTSAFAFAQPGDPTPASIDSSRSGAFTSTTSRSSRRGRAEIPPLFGQRDSAVREDLDADIFAATSSSSPQLHDTTENDLHLDFRSTKPVSLCTLAGAAWSSHRPLPFLLERLSRYGPYDENSWQKVLNRAHMILESFTARDAVLLLNVLLPNSSCMRPMFFPSGRGGGRRGEVAVTISRVHDEHRLQSRLAKVARPETRSQKLCVGSDDLLEKLLFQHVGEVLLPRDFLNGRGLSESYYQGRSCVGGSDEVEAIEKAKVLDAQRRRMRDLVALVEFFEVYRDLGAGFEAPGGDEQKKRTSGGRRDLERQTKVRDLARNLKKAALLHRKSFDAAQRAFLLRAGGLLINRDQEPQRHALMAFQGMFCSHARKLFGDDTAALLNSLANFVEFCGKDLGIILGGELTAITATDVGERETAEAQHKSESQVLFTVVEKCLTHLASLNRMGAQELSCATHARALNAVGRVYEAASGRGQCASSADLANSALVKTWARPLLSALAQRLRFASSDVESKRELEGASTKTLATMFRGVGCLLQELCSAAEALELKQGLLTCLQLAPLRYQRKQLAVIWQVVMKLELGSLPREMPQDESKAVVLLKNL